MTKQLGKNLCLALAALAVGFLVGKLWTHRMRSQYIYASGCGVEARLRVPSGGVLLSETMQQMPVLPAWVNGAIIRAGSTQYFLRRTELSDTNGAGQVRLFGGGSIHFIHRTD